MKTKRWLGVWTIAAWLIGSVASAQTYSVQTFPPPSPLAKDGAPDMPPPRPVEQTGGLSDWIVYRRDCCEGEHRRITPLYSEIYLKVGPSVPVGGAALSRELQTGWSIAGGWKALFFNEEHSRAWVVDAHIINTYESAGGQEPPTQFPLTFFHNGTRSDLVVFNGVAGRKTFSIQDSNRTSFGLGFGRAWYPWNPADHEGRKWRFGADAGGRYGSHRVNFNEFGHVTDVIGSMYTGIYTDIEIPYRGFIWQAGFRFEWAYTFSDILQVTSDIQDLNLTAVFGVRW